MSEKLLKLFLDDLKSIRIVCRNCGSAIEIPIDKLHHASAVVCPGCPPTEKTLLRSAKSDNLARLAAALTELKMSKDFNVEFVVPESDSAAQS
jgi:hydrogenase maturation factor HypF (carbamoyltransferase family)